MAASGGQASVANRSASASARALTIAVMHAPAMTAATRPTTPTSPSWRARLALPLLAALLAYLLASLWPVDLAPHIVGHEPQTVRLQWSELAFEIAADLQLLLLAGVAGGLGSMTQVAIQLLPLLRHPAALTRSLLHWQLLSPLFGMVVAVLFHLVMRGGVMSEEIGAGQLSASGLVVHGLLAGLLSKPAIDRLAEMVHALLHRRRRTRPDAAARAHPVPVVHGVEVQAQGNLRMRATLVVRGARFMAASQAYVNGRPQETLFVDHSQLLVRMKLGTGWLGPGLRVRVVNPPPGGGMSAPFLRG